MRYLLGLLALVCCLSTGMTFTEYINTPIKRETKETLRAGWSLKLGRDVFSPYFMVDDWRRTVQKKLSCKIGKWRGTADNEYWKEYRLEYKFTLRF